MGMSGVLNLKAGPSIPSQADLGRFISRDPIGFRGGLHLFNGAGTSPVTRVDPTGLEWFPLSSMIKDCEAQASAGRGPYVNGALRRMGEHAEFKKLRDAVLAKGVRIQIGEIPADEGGHYDPGAHTITLSKALFGVERSSCPDKINAGLEELMAAILVHEMTHALQDLIANSLHGRGTWQPELEAYKAEARFIDASWNDIGLGYLAVSTRPDLKAASGQVGLLQVLPLANDADLFRMYGKSYLQRL